ncbi:hypothetical protein GCM10027449_26580 [Sinomonas notoginsengisoli]|uniref:hypothetical protein n=1 Tax=Sinomonas notoginsengisoli TaxID=1457311 RepID=UPI001F21D52C|nr:hypothetical protein [Sinomonas notoginsengisoli]
MKSEHSSYTTTHSTDRIAQALRQAYGDLGAEVSSIEDHYSAIPDAGRAQLAVVGEGRGFVGGYRAVQAYVHDHGAQRIIELVALGQGALGRAWGGMRNTVSLNASTQKMGAIADTLRGALPGLA